MTTAPPRISASPEQYTCPKCQCGIAPEDVAVRHPMTRAKEVRAHCDHCNITTVISYELDGGTWRQAAGVRTLKGRCLKALRKSA